MDLDALNVEVRPRNHFEAIDLGCLLARRWWAPLSLCWLATAVPVFVVLAVTLFDRPTLAIVLFWWLKPVYERAPLKMLSGAIFGEPPGVGRALRELPAAIRPQMLARLTIRRLSPTRSFDVPVALLEGLSGERRRARLAVLQRTAGQPAFWLTIVGVHVESFLASAMLVLAWLLVPVGVDVAWWDLILGGGGVWLAWLSNATYFVAVAVVGPMYVAGGFALYLNRRIELEAWDIELGFRRLARRVAGVSGVVAMALLGGAQVEAAAPPAPTPAESKALIEDVLAGEDFHRQSVTRVPAFLEDWFEQEEPAADPAAELAWLGRWLGFLAELVLWAGVAILAVLLARALMRYRDARLPAPPPVPRGPASYALDLDDTRAPTELLEAARDAWHRGRRREAVALLYRAALARLERQHGVAIDRGDTEGDCLAKVRRARAGEAGRLFEELTRVWLATGYAERLPTEATFLALLERSAAQRHG